MISRLTFAAAVFAVLATATLTFAADAHHQQRADASRSNAVAAVATDVVMLPRVEVIGHRSH